MRDGVLYVDLGRRSRLSTRIGRSAHRSDNVMIELLSMSLMSLWSETTEALRGS